MSASYRLISVQELDATLTEAWRSVQLSEPRFASPYFCPEFTCAVASVRDDVRVVVIEDGGRPVGFFPHQRARWGRGLAVAGPLSDYHGVIAVAGSEWSAHELLRAAGISVWTFDHLVDPSARFAPYVTGRASSPQIDLSAGFEQYQRKLGGLPSELARKARKLAREVGPLSFILHQPDTGTLERLLAWKSAQYRRSGVADAFGVRWTGELLRRLMQLQSAQFAGVCSVLRAGDQLVSVHAGMRSRRVLHWWFPTYDPRFARYSPGIILLLRLAEALAGAGVDLLDLGRGDERYKRELMTGAAELHEGFVELPSLLAKARRLRRAAEARAGGAMGASLHLPLRVIRRLERTRRFH